MLALHSSSSRALDLSAAAVTIPHTEGSTQLPAASRALLAALKYEVEGKATPGDVFSILHELANPAYAPFASHVEAIAALLRAPWVSWPIRDYCSDLLAACGGQWADGQQALLEAIDDEETPWGYRLVLTGCCGEEGARRLEEMLPRTKFEETRLRAKVQQTILRLADQVDVTSLLDTLYDGLRWDARASMIMEMPTHRASLAPWVARQMDGAPAGLRAVASTWLVEVWGGGDPEIEAALAGCVSSPDVDVANRAQCARALGSHGTRASLEALASALSSTSSRDLGYACGLAIRSIDDRHPIAVGVQGGLSVALEEQVQGALSQAASAGRGDLTDSALPGSSLVTYDAPESELALSGRRELVASRWDRLGAGPRKLPLAVRLRVYLNRGLFSWGLWLAMGLWNVVLLFLGFEDVETMLLLTIVSSFYVQLPLFVCLLGFGFLSRDGATLRRGRPVLATLMARVGRTSHWRLELPDGNREFPLRGVQEGDTLPVLYHGHKILPLTRFMRYAGLDEHGTLTTPSGIARYSWALPVFAVSSYALIYILAAALLSL